MNTRTTRNPTQPDAPPHLAPETQRWWSDTVARWELEQHHVRLLTLACEAWDRCAEARAIIAAEGLTTETRDGGRKLHPAVRVESDCRLSFARLIRELDLDLDPPVEAKRPAPLRSIG